MTVDMCAKVKVLFKKMNQPRPVFIYFCSYQTPNFRKITVGFSLIRTRVVGLEVKDTDHLTTTTAHAYLNVSCCTEISSICKRIELNFSSFVNLDKSAAAAKPENY